MHLAGFEIRDTEQLYSDWSSINASARMGSSESSFGLNSVSSIDSPSSQVTKSVEKVSAKNLQILLNIKGLYQLLSDRS